MPSNIPVWMHYAFGIQQTLMLFLYCVLSLYIIREYKTKPDLNKVSNSWGFLVLWIVIGLLHGFGFWKLYIS